MSLQGRLIDLWEMLVCRSSLYAVLACRLCDIFIAAASIWTPLPSLITDWDTSCQRQQTLQTTARLNGAAAASVVHHTTLAHGRLVLGVHSSPIPALHSSLIIRTCSQTCCYYAPSAAALMCFKLTSSDPPRDVSSAWFCRREYYSILVERIERPINAIFWFQSCSV